MSSSNDDRYDAFLDMRQSNYDEEEFSSSYGKEDFAVEHDECEYCTCLDVCECHERMSNEAMEEGRGGGGGGGMDLVESSSSPSAEEKDDHRHHVIEMEVDMVEVNIDTLVGVTPYCNGCYPIHQPNQLAHMDRGGCCYIVEDLEMQPIVDDHRMMKEAKRTRKEQVARVSEKKDDYMENARLAMQMPYYGSRRVTCDSDELYWLRYRVCKQADEIRKYRASPYEKTTRDAWIQESAIRGGGGVVSSTLRDDAMDCV